MLDLKNKTILVTGATSGMGRLMCLKMAREGLNVLVHGRTEEKVAKVLEELKTINSEGKYEGLVCDLTKPESISDALEKVRVVDIVINNAGVWLEGATTEATVEKIMELVNVNLASYLLFSKLMLPKLEKSEFGQLLNVVSVAGYEIPSGFYHTIYTATKYGLQGFSEGLTKEFSGKKLRVMAYYPGGMETEIFKKAGNDYKVHEPWMFDPEESVEAMWFMLTRNKKINIKRMDLINHLEE